MGRPKIEIDVARVEELAGKGLSQSEIALSLGINEKTLRRKKLQLSVLSEAIKRGRVNAAEEVSNKLYGLCMEGNLGAIIWYEKTRRKYSDKVIIQREDLDAAIERELGELATGSEGSIPSDTESEAIN